MSTAMLHADIVSPGDADRAAAIREYRRLRASAAAALTLARNRRCSLNMVLRLRDEAHEMLDTARDIRIDWNL